MFHYTRDGVVLALILDTRKPTRKGDYPAKVRVTYRRERKYYPTGKYLMPEEWDRLAESKTRALVELREELSASFEYVRSMVQELLTGGGFSLEALNTRLKRADVETLNDLFRSKIEALRADGNVGNMLVYDNVLKGVERFAGGQIALERVTVEWLRRYNRFLIGEEKSATTMGIHFRTIRAIVNQAKREGLIREADYPFGRGKFEIQEGEGRKMALTLDQIRQIARYDNGSEATSRYRDYWLFLYLCNGINVADFVKLRYRNIVDGELCFVRQKTERTTKVRKEIRVAVTEPMQRIIDRRGSPQAPDAFIFPVLSGDEDALTRKHKTQYLTRAINLHMGRIGKELGFGSISTYTARHSYATVLKRSGANIAYISESLGHSDLKTTENYLASFEKEERQKNAALVADI
ncbi:site-specific integrase [Rikenella microfusus]|uniref:Site-specific tyrosine recombinase XerC n=1 Tax=Rikenella microfusus TaxID=28139 RepID=A0A379MQW6_9BACT|nr:site-specific integrase [Rikenella microfusus]SUE33149.1 site-specific tyrosine recombinase XerC [Rikenella microfusus]HJE87949.1 site-specific integrase [Rikenella microfusus]